MNLDKTIKAYVIYFDENCSIIKEEIREDNFLKLLLDFGLNPDNRKYDLIAKNGKSKKPYLIKKDFSYCFPYFDSVELTDELKLKVIERAKKKLNERN